MPFSAASSGTVTSDSVVGGEARRLGLHLHQRRRKLREHVEVVRSVRAAMTTSSTPSATTTMRLRSDRATSQRMLVPRSELGAEEFRGSAVTTFPFRQAASHDRTVPGVPSNLDATTDVGIAAKVFIHPRRSVNVVENGRVWNDQSFSVLLSGSSASTRSPGLNPFVPDRA